LVVDLKWKMGVSKAAQVVECLPAQQVWDPQFKPQYCQKKLSGKLLKVIASMQPCDTRDISRFIYLYYKYL
jgi:hypothetical protein